VRSPCAEESSPELVCARTAADSRSSERARDRATIHEVAGAQEAEDFEQNLRRQAVELRGGRRHPRADRGTGRVAGIGRCWRRRCFRLVMRARTTGGGGTSRADNLANIPARVGELGPGARRQGNTHALASGPTSSSLSSSRASRSATPSSSADASAASAMDPAR